MRSSARLVYRRKIRYRASYQYAFQYVTKDETAD